MFGRDTYYIQFNDESIIECCSSQGIDNHQSKVKLLYKRLELKCWEGMLDPESPIFEPTLLALVQKKKSKNQKATCQRQPWHEVVFQTFRSMTNLETFQAKNKKTADEDEKGGEEDGDEDEDEGDEGQEDQEDEDEEQDDEEDEDQEEQEDDAMEDDEEDQDDDMEDPKPRRKTKGAAGKAKAKAKAAGKAKAKAKGKGKAKGRPKVPLS